jgi:hypothetical protein
LELALTDLEETAAQEGARAEAAQPGASERGTVRNFVRERRFDIQAAARVKRSPKSTAN